jgi:hypothetical protein
MNKREFVRTLGGASLGLMFSPSVRSTRPARRAASTRRLRRAGVADQGARGGV